MFATWLVTLLVITCLRLQLAVSRMLVIIGFWQKSLFVMACISHLHSPFTVSKPFKTSSKLLFNFSEVFCSEQKKNSLWWKLVNRVSVRLVQSERHQ